MSSTDGRTEECNCRAQIRLGHERANIRTQVSFRTQPTPRFVHTIPFQYLGDFTSLQRSSAEHKEALLSDSDHMSV